MGEAFAREAAVPATAAPSASERLLHDAAERALRAPRDRMAIVLHLSRLRPPAPRAHHERIARALMHDTAQRYTGQVFPLRNTDLVLLCTAPEAAGRMVSGASPADLPQTLARLFGADARDPAHLTSLWRLDRDADMLRGYLAGQRGGVSDSPRAGEIHRPDDIGTLAAMQDLLEHTPAADLLRQQTAVRLRPGHGLPLSARLTPVFREFRVGLGPLAARAGVTHADGADALSDPYLAHYLATRLDARVMAVLHDDLASMGPVTRMPLRQDLALHLSLTVGGIVSPGFGRLSIQARARAARLGVELSLTDIAADPDMAHYAATLVQAAGWSLVIDGLDHAALSLCRPGTMWGAMRPDIVKLAWSAHLAGADEDALAAALAGIAPAQVVLHRVDTEAAILWGQAHGIQHIQGYLIDAIQAATRMTGCHSALACSLRQCISRSGAISQQDRAGCANPGLLDATGDLTGLACGESIGAPGPAVAA